MCGNRVEELESRVQELEASVKGLTDELVECKVRLRDLEDANEERAQAEQAATASGTDDETVANAVETAVQTETGESEEPAEETETPAEAATTAESTPAPETDERTAELDGAFEDGSEVFGPSAAPHSETAETADEADKPAEDEVEDSTEEQGSDIIVA